jgi:hypothetical protein
MHGPRIADDIPSSERTLVATRVESGEWSEKRERMEESSL